MPQLRVVGPGGKEEWFPLDAEEYILGRDPAAAIRLQDKKVSRKHARIFKRREQYYVEDLGSSNGVLFGGVVIQKPTRLSPNTSFEISTFILTFLADEEPSPEIAFFLIGLNGPVDGKTYGALPLADVYVGRSADCDIVIADGSISRQHAILEVSGDALAVQDLGSSNGTFVNDLRVGKGERQALGAGDRLRFGNIQFDVAAEADQAAFGGDDAEEGWFSRLRQADNSLKLAAGMGVMTVLLLAVVIGLLVWRAAEPSATTDPFAMYDQVVETKLNEAEAYALNSDWDNAITTFSVVLDQDPQNERGRAGLDLALRAKDHVLRLAQAGAELKAGRAQAAIDLLAAIPADSRISTQAAALLRDAKTTRAKQALEAANAACNDKDWRQCHNNATTLLYDQPDSAEGKKLVVLAERAMRKRKLPFTPWAP